MARELGMNPKRLGKLDNHDQEPWKAPLPQYIEHLYQRRFARERPATIRSIEEIARAEQARKAARKAAKAAARATTASATAARPVASADAPAPAQPHLPPTPASQDVVGPSDDDDGPGDVEDNEVGGTQRVEDRARSRRPPLDPRGASRRDGDRAPRVPRWRVAQHVLRELLELEVGAVHEVGRVVHLGEGLSRDLYGAEVELVDGRADKYVVALPRSDADHGLAGRTRRELRLLARLRGRPFPFDLPEMVGALSDGGPPALVRRFVRAIELDLRAGRQPSVEPWTIVGEIAAAIHAVPGAELEDLLPGAATRRAHAVEALAALDGVAPELRDARAWAEAHLPPDEPSCLLHGDLLGHNILLTLVGPPCVIDWEYARRGDPAYDLAIVTRGVRQPFQVADGLDRLLDAYHAQGGATVTANHVHLHELCVLAARHRSGHGPAAHDAPPARAALDGLRALLRRLR